MFCCMYSGSREGYSIEISYEPLVQVSSSTLYFHPQVAQQENMPDTNNRGEMRQVSKCRLSIHMKPGDTVRGGNNTGVEYHLVDPSLLRNWQCNDELSVISQHVLNLSPNTERSKAHSQMFTCQTRQCGTVDAEGSVESGVLGTTSQYLLQTFGFDDHSVGRAINSLKTHRCRWLSLIWWKKKCIKMRSKLLRPVVGFSMAVTLEVGAYVNTDGCVILHKTYSSLPPETYSSWYTVSTRAINNTKWGHDLIV